MKLLPSIASKTAWILLSFSLAIGLSVILRQRAEISRLHQENAQLTEKIGSHPYPALRPPDHTFPNPGYPPDSPDTSHRGHSPDGLANQTSPSGSTSPGEITATKSLRAGESTTGSRTGPAVDGAPPQDSTTSETIPPAPLDINDLTFQSTPPQVAGKTHWDHGQATGPPDTPDAGDKPTAWAPLRPQSGEQWLALGYDNAVEIQEINVLETHNPGSIAKIAAILPDGSEKTLWQGTATQPENGEDALETSLPVPKGTTASQIKVYLDTTRVQSWPEIDAVEMVGTNGSRQWATTSSASSSYSENYAPGTVNQTSR